MVNPHLKLEQKLWSEDYNIVVGIDEVGRGPWAGPLVAGAVCFRKGFEPNFEVRDSKKLSEKRREELNKLIMVESLSFGLGFVKPKVLDRVGLTEGVNIAMLRALNSLEVRIKSEADYLIVDGSKVREIEGYKQSRRDRGDDIHFSVASASIIAKVARDRKMVDLSKIYPNYGFENHKGYGTKQHKESLQEYGPCSIHRLSYKPVREIKDKQKEQRIKG